MNFDIPTLMAAGALATAAVGLLVGIAWIADRDARALPWWAIGYLLLAVGIAGLLFGNAHPDGATFVLASFILTLSPTFMWAGARIFAYRRPQLAGMAIGPLVYLLSVAIQPAYHLPQLTMTASLGVVSVYLALAVRELYRQRAEKLGARWPLIGFLVIHAAVFSSARSKPRSTCSRLPAWSASTSSSASSISSSSST